MLLDVSRMVWRAWSRRLPTGIDRVCLAYIAHYRGRARGVVQRSGFHRILSAGGSRRLFDLLQAGGPSFRGQLIRSLPNLLGSGQIASGSKPFYLNVGHTGLDQPRFRRWAMRADVRPIYLVHDLIPITHPQFARAGERERHEQRMETVCLTGSGIIANSAATLDELRRWAKIRGLSMPPATVAWLGTEALPIAEHSPASDPRPYFVVLGTIEGRKNHKLLLDVWRTLAQGDASERAPRLVIVGQRGWAAEETHRMLDQDPLLRGLVIERPRCSDAQLSALLAGARALLFPSFAEGFGMPLTEGLSAGLPVIANDLPVFRELAGDIPLYVNGADRTGWRDAVMRLAQDDSELARQRARTYAAPTWAEHFEQVDAWLVTLG